MKARPTTALVAASKEWITAAVRADLMGIVDDFIERNDIGFYSRGQVIAAALREFFERHPLPATRRLDDMTPAQRALHEAADRIMAEKKRQRELSERRDG